MDFLLLSQLPLQVCLRGNLPLPVALPLFAVASGGREACQSQKLLESLEHLTMCHPQIMISAEGNVSRAALLRGRSFTGKEGCVWGEELTFPPTFTKYISAIHCAWTKTHLEGARRFISTSCSHQHMDYPCSIPYLWSLGREGFARIASGLLCLNLLAQKCNLT